MKIGIAKFGTVINETNGLSNNIGHMLEVFNTIDILSKKHDVYIINKLNKPINYKEYKGEKLDKLIVFNGPMSRTNTTKFGGKTLQMMERYTYPIIEFINAFEGDWYYINPDIRYSIDRIKPKELVKQPKKIITLLGDDNYFGLDKLWLYNRKFVFEQKLIDLGLIYNDTSSKRTKKLRQLIDVFDGENYSLDLIGKFKEPMPLNSGSLEEGGYYEWLKTVKYTVNISNDPLQITPRLWDNFMCNVVGFIMNFDMNYKVVPENHYLRVKDEYDVFYKMNELQQNPAMLQMILDYQRSFVKSSYLDGTYMLGKFEELLYDLHN